MNREQARSRVTAANGSRFDSRALHLIDAENLLAGPRIDASDFRQMWQTYRGAVPTSASDQFRVGASSFFVARAFEALIDQGFQLLVRDGADGAELALLDSIDLAHVGRRFDRLVIASGDGRFEDLALQARSRGLYVHVVNGLSDCSRALARAATTRAHLRLSLPEVEQHAGARTLAKRATSSNSLVGTAQRRHNAVKVA
jgi:hypothetical protein